MQPFSSLFISFISLFWGGVTSEVNDFFVMGNLSLKWLGFKPFLVAYPFISCLIGMTAIGSILAVICNPKIAKSVIRFIPINMINLLGGVIAGHVKPSKPMGGAMSPINFKINIPPMMTVASDLAYPNFGPRLGPCKNPRIGIIGKYIQKVLMIDMLHDLSIKYFARTEKD